MLRIQSQATTSVPITSHNSTPVPPTSISHTQEGEKRLKGVQLALPFVTGTIAFYLGKKATDTATHRWTAYMRGPNNEDLSHILKKCVIVLHESFKDPDRALEFQPYEVTEIGWGEFDLAIQLHFHDDAMEPPVELYHRLRLYDDQGQNSIKKPVVYEVYEEIVIWEPTETFYNRIMAQHPQQAPMSQYGQFYTMFSAEHDYKRVQAARQRVAQIEQNVKNQLAALEAEALAIS
jgi:YEATS domain-containing protein 4